jgi:hypothetical protein
MSCWIEGKSWRVAEEKVALVIKTIVYVGSRHEFAGN